MTKRLVALRETYHNGTRHVGEAFDCDEVNAAIHVGLGNARLEDLPPSVAPAPEPAPVVQTRALKAEEAPPQPVPMTTQTADVLTQVKRRYKRRDMRAER